MLWMVDVMRFEMYRGNCMENKTVRCRLALGLAGVLLASVLRADSGFRLQRVGNPDGTPAYSGSFDERNNQPIRVVNLKLPNGTVRVMSSAEVAQLDIDPLEDFSVISPDRRAELEKFIRTTVVPFLRLLRKPQAAVAAGPQVARNASQVFPSSDVPNAFQELADASIDPENNEPRIRGCVGRLNTALHPLGLHLTFGRFMEFEGGTVELTIYAITKRLLVQINDRTLPVYVLSPFDDVFRVAALGMMEPYPPRIFIFDDMVSLQVADISAFLKSDKDYDFEDPNVPVATIPKSIQAKINQIVRRNLRDAVGTDHHAVQRWLTNCVARHEGQHLYIDRGMKAAAEARTIEWDDFNLFHERQAYLFELETSDPEFTSFVLLASFAISAALSDKYSRVGCGAALRGLQQELPSMHFWDGDFNRPIANGLVPLFEASPSGIRAGASRARRAVEQFIFSSINGPSATATADQ